LASTISFFTDMVQTIADRGRSLIARPREGLRSARDLADLAEEILSGRGEASAVARARDLLDLYAGAPPETRRAFLKRLALDFGPALGRVEEAIEAYRSDPGPLTARALHEAAEPRRQELLRRLNRAPGGTRALVRMREDVLPFLADHPDLADVDADFAHLFNSWFNRGFLTLKRIDWTSPANVLEKIIAYEAVHAIQGFEDLRRRLAPPDRRLYAFFHPALVEEPLIFVEVALTRDIPGAIRPILAPDHAPLSATEATTAVFYSISNCQKGLAGISFGNFLIKQVVEELRRDLPGLKTFVTLSPSRTGPASTPPSISAPRWTTGRRTFRPSCASLPRPISCAPRPPAGGRSIRWRAFISATAPGSSASIPAPTCRPGRWSRRRASW
jgi:malonyl-CoA decarboxylase